MNRFAILLSTALILGAGVPAFSQDVIPWPPYEAPCACDPAAPPNFERPIFTAMDAEAYGLSLVSTLPQPIPGPKAFKDLLHIADTFEAIGGNVMSMRSLSLKASLPIPVPGPGRASVMPLPPPDVLVGQALQLQRHTLRLVDAAGTQILSAQDRGSIAPDDADYLLFFQSSLHEEISVLPIPIPGPVQ